MKEKTTSFSVFYIHVAKYALKTEFSYTEEVRNRRAFNFVRATIGFSEEIALLRNKIWRRFGSSAHKRGIQGYSQ